MEQLVLSGKELLAIGFTPSPAVAKAMEAVQRSFPADQRNVALEQLRSVLLQPLLFTSDAVWSDVALALISQQNETVPLIPPVPYTSYGEAFIDEGARGQMQTAVRLPVAVAGALMPDAHQGYGLPIGGVLATDNAVIPYGVGVDIGCRMCLSIYDIPESHFYTNESKYKRELIAHTKFGAGSGFSGSDRSDHQVLSDDGFNTTRFVSELKDKAYTQLGSSGGGNHFVEFGILEMLAQENELGIPKGKYIALLSHSGSRGLGATIANHYTKLARSVSRLPKEAAHLAYFDLDSEEGQEYWRAMNLAGAYASACHEIIHDKITKSLGAGLLARVENHHNFAWKEHHNGRDVIVHRKGATPAGKGELGIIPGSMTAPGFLVRGKGNPASLNSASHGAGRQMSRTKANQTITSETMRKQLKESGVTLIGGGTDEAPAAYKDIHQVMAAQQDLVEVQASFSPKMVRMADDGSRED
ncbi:RtcB family protein [Flavihumibacter solisilvae]|uniref:3'-phosphate/5'-hydroxy nucleic acid ligase n=1 Tax=Flavihumibacter solisilvae TaxID=1349421 RepID=A0A0C1L7X7_9BACT|nr:RtcB family protein [Flavihumibacter solisilvae]KIC96262.1 RNA 2',3'-cyclic phosphate--5'-hydroxyl ligase [Flavihumibacter solisilvae]